ncbi:MAG: hypothetical protein GX413_13810 [Acetobacter sp.]|nr:hypothetical protein [Acetobacter sp.]
MMGRHPKELVTAWVRRSGEIVWTPGVGFPDQTIPLCCGSREALKTALRERAFNGRYYEVPGVCRAGKDQDAFELVEKLRVSLCGLQDILSYYSAMNRRDVG